MAKDLLDLHGFKAEDVEVAIDNFLVKISKTKLKKARIMTGKGSGVVQSITVKYLKLAGYHWSYEVGANGKPNTGCLVLHLE